MPVKLTALTGAILLAALAVLAASLGVADLNSRAADKIAAAESSSRKSSADALLSEAEWRRALDLKHKARAQAPLNASHALELADLYKSGLQRQDPLGDRADAAEMLKHYGDAVRLRPTWARAWASFAAARYRYYGADQLVQLAMERAIELGSMEPDVISRISWLSASVSAARTLTKKASSPAT